MDVHHHHAHDEREPEPADEAEVGEQAPDLEPLEHGGEIEVQRSEVEYPELYPHGGQDARGAPRAAHRWQALVPIAGRLRHRVCLNVSAPSFGGQESRGRGLHDDVRDIFLTAPTKQQLRNTRPSARDARASAPGA